MTEKSYIYTVYYNNFGTPCFVFSSLDKEFCKSFIEIVNVFYKKWIEPHIEEFNIYRNVVIPNFKSEYSEDIDSNIETLNDRLKEFFINSYSHHWSEKEKFVFNFMPIHKYEKNHFCGKFKYGETIRVESFDVIG